MKLKLKQVQPIIDFYTEVEDKAFSFQTAYKLNKLYNSLLNNQTFFNNNFAKIVEEYADKKDDGSFKMDETGESILIKEDLIDECNKKLYELENTEIDCADVDFDFSEFDGLPMTPKQIAIIMPLIKKEAL